MSAHQVTHKFPPAVLSWLRSNWDILLLLLSVLGASWPILVHGWPHTADGPLHLFRLALLSDSIQQGILYPRWTPQLVLGFGYPLFHFYGPATYYVGLVLKGFGLNDAQAILGTFILLATAAGLGMRALALDLFASSPETRRRWQGFIAAAAYLFAPYLLTNIYVRGAIAEVGAQALLPWIFWSFRRLVVHERPERYFLPAAILLSLLALTHNISLLFIPIALLIYLAVLMSRGRWHRLRWVVPASITAMGLSAFFWLTVMMEREFLSDIAYQQAQGFILGHSWNLETILDWAWQFQYSSIPPFRLGVVQLLLAVAGFLLARRTDREWFYWLFLTILGGVGISQLAAPIWQSSDLLLAAQFPWRLLILVTPGAALFTAGILSPIKKPNLIIPSAGALTLIIFLANWPSISWSGSISTGDINVHAGTVAQFEKEFGALGTSSSQEFMPRWVEQIDLRSMDDPGMPRRSIKLLDVTPQEMVVNVSSNENTPLRWTDFYFPGKQIALADGTILPTAPTTPAGLLTVDVPAGENTISLSTTRTLWQNISLGITVISAMALLGFAGIHFRSKWGWGVIGLLLIGGFFSVRTQASSLKIAIPSQEVQTTDIQLLGYQTVQQDNFLEIFPYWYIHQKINSFQPLWQLRTADNTIVASMQHDPYYATGTNLTWPSGTIVDDAYLLPLPAGLPAGSYQLEIKLTAEASILPLPVGTIELDETLIDVRAIAAQSVAVFGNEISVAGFDLKVNHREISAEPYPIVQAGDRLEYTLYWQAVQSPSENYHGTVTLTDSNWRPLAQRDQHLGRLYNLPRLWHPDWLQADSYRLQIPEDAPSGLYWPRLGVYTSNQGEINNLEVFDPAGNPLGGSHTLSPIKVVNTPNPQQSVIIDIKMGDFATITGYDLSLPSTLEAGKPFTLTLNYASLGPAPLDYIRFVQLYSPEHGIVAQKDTNPQNGINPTSTWVKDEIIVEEVELTVAETAPAGSYQLLVGFYNPADGQRLPLFAANGQRLQNDQILLREVILP